MLLPPGIKLRLAAVALENCIFWRASGGNLHRARHACRCIRKSQGMLAQSSKRLIESKIASLGIGSGFKLFSDKIETPGDGIVIFRGM